MPIACSEVAAPWRAARSNTPCTTKRREPPNSFALSNGPSGTTRLLRARTDYAFSPRMFASALVQYNSADRTFGTNLRYRWEYQPGSELFLVYTDEHDTSAAAGLPALRNRAFVVKVNRLFRF